jgi:hypothetical protein
MAICPEDPSENDCRVCQDLDIYAPCPQIGYGCGWSEEPCDCCTDEQRSSCSDVTTTLKEA